MKRVNILCEGQTEEQFVNRILSPYFMNQDIFVRPIILTTKRYISGGRERGGVSTYKQIADQLCELCKDRNAYITTMLDYYRLPEDTPCMDLQGMPTYEHVASIERAINDSINATNCHANLIVHEFEALLFSEPAVFACIANQEVVAEIAEIRREFANPEDINSSVLTAPSKRILSIKPDYRKVAQGLEIAVAIGIDRMIANCPHFAEWIDRIKNS